ncbi:MAG: helix-turn-helix transcriptional regulator [Bdellovibrionales bacterium]|nr:helix-turn-helix transcriptional regulator [Bdellovibrionales bacterium]
MQEPDFGHVAEFIRNYRNAHGLSLAQLAEKAGVSRSMIFQIEGGKTVPTLGVVSKLAHAMGTPVSSLIDPYQNNHSFYCRKAKGRPQLEIGGGITLIPFAAETSNRKIEIFEFQIKHKGRFELPLYPPGTTEYILVQSGEAIFQGIVDKSIMKPGDGVETRASIKRYLIREGTTAVKGILVRYFGCAN